MKRMALVVLVATVLVTGGAVSLAQLQAQQPRSGVAGQSDDVAGIVRSAKGPEAGVWVIAETDDFDTTFAKIVVTDDQGRYLIPDLPRAKYKVWVRGYGLIDSNKVEVTPGSTVNLTAVIAPSPRAAAQYYPANYWYSLLEVPPPSAFPMEKEGIQDQLQWISIMKSAMQFYQVGDKATREIPEKLGRFKTSEEAWQAWVETNESGLNMFTRRLPRQLAVKYFANWTDRIASGELPPAPPRPKGLERNLVVTMWDWSDDKGFIHDVMTTDSRNPTVNSNGIIYGPEQYSGDNLVMLDPVTNKQWEIPVPHDPALTPNWEEQGNLREGRKGDVPLTWGDEIVRPAKMRLHNAMMDHLGRIWVNGRFRDGSKQPAYCLSGSTHPSASRVPIPRNGDLQLELFDPKTQKITLIDTCYSAGNHLIFAEDPLHTLWFSGGNEVAGYFHTKVWDETGDSAKAQGWCAYVLDTNGNGKADSYAGIDDPIDPTKDKRIRAGGYGVAYNPADGSIWKGLNSHPGAIVRVHPGTNPPETCLTEKYDTPSGLSAPKGVYADRATGVVWAAFAGSGHFASFDRRKCKVLNGPTATGNHCPEGWTIYPIDSPNFKGATAHNNADWYYLNWVDQFDFLGLGKNVPLAPGTNSDSIVALLPESKTVLHLRIPYPLGFYARGMDGRIDDPNGGWKGKAIWTNYASVSPWTYEGGKGQTPKVVKFQVRPNPLAN